MKKRIILVLLLPLMCGGQVMARSAPQEQPSYASEQLSQESLDTLLAPIALYPDTLITHILIASTYPLQVVEADRWRQQNDGLKGDRLEQALNQFDWDPSVKALVPFTDVLRHMSNDLAWLQNMGDAVITNEDRVLERIQALRLQAHNSGNLQSNDYQKVSANNKIIVIESRQPEVIYVPYYDTRYVYGNWHYHTAPVFWPSAVRIALGHRIFWGPYVSISAGFYFGDIWWPDRHIVIRNEPSRHYVKAYYPQRRQYSVKEYHRWQHNVEHRHARYSKQVVTHKPAVVEKHRSINSAARHRELYTKTQATAGSTVRAVKPAAAPHENRASSQNSQNAKQLKQRLKSHEVTGNSQYRDLKRTPDQQVQSTARSNKERDFRHAERQQPARQQPKEQRVAKENKWSGKAPSGNERPGRAYSEPRQHREVKQAQSRASRPNPSQQSHTNRAH